MDSGSTPHIKWANRYPSSPMKFKQAEKRCPTKQPGWYTNQSYDDSSLALERMRNMFKPLSERLPSLTQNQIPSSGASNKGTGYLSVQFSFCLLLVATQRTSHPAGPQSKQLCLLPTTWSSSAIRLLYLLQNKERQSRVKEAEAGAERGDDEGYERDLG